MTEGQSYILVKSTYYLKKKSFVCYGIALIEPDEPVSTILKTVNNISCDQRIVSDFVDLCNRLRPNLSQLDDMIEEFLS